MMSFFLQDLVLRERFIGCWPDNASRYLRIEALSGGVAASLHSLFPGLRFESLFSALAPPVNLPFTLYLFVFSHANLRCLTSAKNA